MAEGKEGVIGNTSKWKQVFERVNPFSRRGKTVINPVTPPTATTFESTVPTVPIEEPKQEAAVAEPVIQPVEETSSTPIIGIAEDKDFEGRKEPPFDRKKVLEGLRTIQKSKNENSIREITSIPLSEQELNVLVERTTFGPQEVADSLLLSNITTAVYEQLDPADQFLALSQAKEIGMKFYLSYVRSFIEELPPKNITLTQQDPDIEDQTNSFFQQLAKSKNIVEPRVLEQASVLFRSHREYTQRWLGDKWQYAQAMDGVDRLANTIASDNFFLMMREVNYLKQLNHVYGLFTERTSYDLVQTSFVDMLSRIAPTPGNLYEMFASSNARTLVGKILHKYSTAQFNLQEVYGRRLNKEDFDSYTKGPWEEMTETALKMRGGLRDVYFGSIALMAPPQVAVEMDRRIHQGDKAFVDKASPNSIWRQAYEIMIKRLEWASVFERNPNAEAELQQIKMQYQQ